MCREVRRLVEEDVAEPAAEDNAEDHPGEQIVGLLGGECGRAAPERRPPREQDDVAPAEQQARRCRRARTSGSRARARRAGSRRAPGRCRERSGRRTSRLRHRRPALHRSPGRPSQPADSGLNRDRALCSKRDRWSQGGTSMEYRYLGRSGLKVSVLTMGTMTFGGVGNFAKVGASSQAEASALIDRCIDAGINLLDTADVYSRGLSEEIIGDALAGKRPGGVLLASKVRFRMGDGPNDEGLSRHHILRQRRGEPAAAEDRRARYPLSARVGRGDAARGNAVGARHARARRQGPLRRLLELFRLAPDEGTRRRRRARLSALRHPADPLYARGARGRVRARADRGRRGRRHPRLEPARRAACSRASTGPRTTLPGRSPGGASRRSATSTACGASSPL